MVVANEALKRDRMRRVHISPAAVDPVQSGRWTAPTSHLQTLRCTTRTDGAEQSSAPARTRSRRGWLLQHRRRISEVADAAGMTVEDVLTITQKLSEEQLDEFIERLGEPWIAPHGTGSGPHRRPFHAIQFERLAREERDRAIFEWIRHHGSQRAWSESDLRRQVGQSADSASKSGGSVSESAAAVWEYALDQGWFALADEVQGTLEAAHAAGQTQITYKHDGGQYTYRIDLNSMTLTNLKSGRKRGLRRRDQSTEYDSDSESAASGDSTAASGTSDALEHTQTWSSPHKRKRQALVARVAREVHMGILRDARAGSRREYVGETSRHYVEMKEPAADAELKRATEEESELDQSELDDLRRAIEASTAEDGSARGDGTADDDEEQLTQAILNSVVETNVLEMALIKDSAERSFVFLQGATSELRDQTRVSLPRGLDETTVLALKCLFYQQVQSSPLELMTLQLAGKPTMDSDDASLASCGVVEGATVHISNKIRGGGGGGVKAMFGCVTRSPSSSSSLQRRGSVGESAYFKAFAPQEIVPDAKPFVIEVSAFTLAYTVEVDAGAYQRQKIGVGSRGPLRLRVGTNITIRLEMPTDAFETDGLADSIEWTGAWSTAQFQATCLRGAELGPHICQATVDVDGRREAVLRFELNVIERRLGSPPVTPPTTSTELASDLSIRQMPPQGSPRRAEVTPDQMMVPHALQEENRLLTDALLRSEAFVHTRSLDDKKIDFADISDITATGKTGAFGSVYKARWTTGGNIVAIKAVKSQRGPGAEEFEQEISFALTVTHPNIVLALGVTNGRTDGHVVRPMLVMEWLEFTLLEYLRDKTALQPLASHARDALASGVVSGMIYLSRHKSVAHLDLKSTNILMDGDRPKIADFGLSQSAQYELVSRATPARGAPPGSCAWMAPEVFERNISAKADVYSFGVVLWEIVAPQGLGIQQAWEAAAFGSDQPNLPASAGSSIPVWAKRGLRPEIPSAVDAHFRGCVEQCWRTDPHERPTFTQIQANFFPEFNISRTHSPLSVRSSASSVPALASSPQEGATAGRAAGGGAWDAWARPHSETAVTLWLRAAGLGRVADSASQETEYCDMESFEDMLEWGDARLVAGQRACEAGAGEAQLQRFVRSQGLTDAEAKLLRDALAQLA